MPGGGQLVHAREQVVALDVRDAQVDAGGAHELADRVGHRRRGQTARVDDDAHAPRGDLGQVALAAFNNPTGLERAGDTAFRATANSGEAAMGVAGTGPFGSIAGGTVEMSNVDLAAEFTNMISAQRGFQANSRVITASDEILQDLVNMKR